MLVEADSHRNGHACVTDLSATVKDRLLSSPYMLVRQVSVRCEQGVVRLRGRLPSFYQKQLAQAAVRDLEGVSQVINEIEVA
jgi:osmotically-inducible protein OsmY